MERMIQYKEELGQSRKFKEENTDYTYTQMHTHTDIWRYLKNTGASIHHKMTVLEKRD